MPTVPSPISRAVEGLAEFSGRTLVILGPPMSGKSRLLGEIRGAVEALGSRVVELRGSYRGRSVPYSALDGLHGAVPPAEPSETEAVPGEDFGSAEAPMAPLVFDPDRLPQGRRRRGSRPRGAPSILGDPVRTRSSNEGDPNTYWQELLPEFRGAEAHPVALLIDDGALFDAESREFVITLSTRARLRPLLIVLALDSSVPGSALWEEAFFGRGDVDWIRLPESATDARESHRVKEIVDDLPGPTRRVIDYLALLGGEVTEVALARVARLSLLQLAESLQPALGRGLVKVREGKVATPQKTWPPVIVDLIPEGTRRVMHFEIAEALSALSPEPSLLRRIEVARHYLEGQPGPMAMARLLQAAEICLDLVSFDPATELLADAVGCLGSIRPAERSPIEAELRLLFARALLFAGRPAEGEAQVREGVAVALGARVSGADLAGWIEPLLVALRAAGPRPSLATTLIDLAERCHEAEMIEVEVLLEALVAEFYAERNLSERARTEALRAAKLAQGLPERHLQALGLLTVGFSLLEGSPAEQRQAERYLRAARYLLGNARRWELDYVAGEFEARLFESRGEVDRAKELRERSVATLERERLPSIELVHELGIAQILLDRGLMKSLEAPLLRARTIAETLHLLPPSSGLLRLWLLDGRQLAVNGSVEAARDRWDAIVDLPPNSTLPKVRAEAIVRLSLLLQSTGRSEEGAAMAELLSAPDVASALPRSWSTYLPRLAELAPTSERGGGRFPPAPPSAGKSDREAGERRRRDAVRDRQRTD